MTTKQNDGNISKLIESLHAQVDLANHQAFKTLAGFYGESFAHSVTRGGRVDCKHAIEIRKQISAIESLMQNGEPSAGKDTYWDLLTERDQKQLERRERREQRRLAFDDALTIAGGPGVATIVDVSNHLGIHKRTVHNMVSKYNFDVLDGIICKRSRS
jgi:hypothetical protein